MKPHLVLLELLAKHVRETQLEPVVPGSPVSAWPKVTFKGFGSFQVRKYQGYVGRSPHDGSSVSVPASLLTTVKSDADLMKAVDNGETNLAPIQFEGTTSLDLSSLLQALEKLRSDLIQKKEGTLDGLGTFAIKKNRVGLSVLTHSVGEACGGQNSADSEIRR